MPRFPNTFSSTSAKTPKGKLKTKNESKTVAAANDNRIGLWLTPGAKDVWVALGPTAVSGEGIKLPEKGTPIYITGYTGIVTCIAASEEPEIGIAEI